LDCAGAQPLAGALNLLSPKGTVQIKAKEPNRASEVASKLLEEGLRLTGPEAGLHRPGDIMQIFRVISLAADDDSFVVGALPGHP